MAIVFHTFCSIDQFVDAAIEFGYDLQESDDGWFAYDTSTHSIMGSFAKNSVSGTIERITENEY